MSPPQLKIVHEVIALFVFVPFAICFMRVPVGLDFVWAGLCLLGAVFFAFRGVGVPL
jgi:uncharacterized protein (DUF486 family)